MKKIISFVLTFALMLTALCMVACDDADSNSKEGLLYKKDKDAGYCIVYGFETVKKDGKIVDLDENGKLDIAKIATEKNVTIGAIGKEAFKGNAEIKEIVLPDTVEVINEGAFSEMPNLISLTVPFIGKNKNTDSTIGATGKGEEKAVDLQRTMYFWFGTEEYDGGAKVTSKYSLSATEATYYLPVGLKTLNIKATKVNDEVTYEVPAFACYNNKILTKVTFENVKKLGDYSFAECSKITDMDTTGITLGDNAFLITK